MRQGKITSEVLTHEVSEEDLLNRVLGIDDATTEEVTAKEEAK
jgi:hypothetical protein